MSDKIQPLVGVIMGSDSDLAVMKAASDALNEFAIPHEVTIVSAHRTPDRMYDYSRGVAARGLKVIIAGAGGAAHLPGMVAALTPLPVIGVPIKTSSLDGFDSLLSIVQMPRGVPVATVAINNARNAGLLAARILATGDPAMTQRIAASIAATAEAVTQAAVRLERLGPAQYLAEKDKL